MKKDYTLKPVKFPQSNMNYGGGKHGILPVSKNEGTILSIWKVSSIKARIIFLFTGKINLCITGEKQPPVWLSIGNAFTE